MERRVERRRRRHTAPVGIGAGLAVALVLASCARVVVGAGREVSRTFLVAPFSKVLVAGPFSVAVRRGAIPGVTLRANANVLDDVSVVSSQDTLHLEVDPRVTLRRARLAADVTLPQLRALDASSDARVALDGLSMGRGELSVGGGSAMTGRLAANDLSLEASDGAAMTLAGSVAMLHVDGDGDSSLRLDGLQARVAEVHLDDADARLWVLAEMSVDLSRGARAFYRGSPRFEERKLQSGARLVSL